MARRDELMPRRVERIQADTDEDMSLGCTRRQGVMSASTQQGTVVEKTCGGPNRFLQSTVSLLVW